MVTQPDLQRIIIQTRQPSRSDPGGAIEEGMFAETPDGCVQLYSLAGKSLGPKFKQPIPPGWTAKEKAARMLRAKTSQRYNDFGRPIIYPRGF